MHGFHSLSLNPGGAALLVPAVPAYVYSEPGGVWGNRYGTWGVASGDNYLQQADIQFGVSLRF